MKTLWELFCSFFSIGLFTFGGGYAMLPMIQREIVQKRHWATEEEILDCFAIAQCTPGIIAVNTATFIGYKTKKILGSVVATLAIILPSLIIISIIAFALKNYAANEYVAHALVGIRIAVAALLCKTLFGLYKKGVQGALGNAVFFASLFLAVLTDISPVILVGCAILLGALLRKAGKKL